MHITAGWNYYYLLYHHHEGEDLGVQETWCYLLFLSGTGDLVLFQMHGLCSTFLLYPYVFVIVLQLLPQHTWVGKSNSRVRKPLLKNAESFTLPDNFTFPRTFPSSGHLYRYGRIIMEPFLFIKPWLLKHTIDYFGFAKRSFWPKIITARLISVLADFWSRQMLFIIRHRETSCN